MGPLSETGVYSHEISLLIAFIIGICFGFILEQAGFSSSRKLAGVFYGYDFVVLRVFFTAAITGMTGLLILEHLGLMDLSLIYVNLYYVKAAIIGGVIMGFGFIIGGFCPGTSVCAAAIGKIDAMAFLGGIFLGIIFFAEAYPLFKEIYVADYKENIKLPEMLGIEDGIFALIVIIIAIAAFYFTSLIEKRVKKVDY